MGPALPDLSVASLLALDALIEHSSVSRAAAALGHSQSSLSHTLARLRRQLDDPLLVRAGGRMQPTPRAEALRAPLRRALAELRLALAEPSFDPAATTRELVIAASDASMVMLMPDVLARLSAQAPGVDLTVRPLERRRVAAQLEDGAVDLAIGVAPPEHAGLVQQRLTREGFCVLVSGDHPDVRGELSLEQYLRWPHLLISPAGSGPGMIDALLAERGLSRRVALRVPYFMSAPSLVARSQLLLTAPQWTARRLAPSFGLQCLPPPLPTPVFACVQLWHERWSNDPFHSWLRAQLHGIASVAREQIGPLSVGVDDRDPSQPPPDPSADPQTR